MQIFTLSIALSLINIEQGLQYVLVTCPIPMGMGLGGKEGELVIKGGLVEQNA